jgi:poly(A) polymerase
MIKRFIQRVLTGRSKSRAPLSIPAKSHHIDRSHISSCARRVTDGLQEAGFKAFVVGGAVRDLMLGFVPKDYDVATDALPEEVRSIFRRSRIIGRRFKLVHVMCGPETVEVSTFRGMGSADEEGHERDEHGRILRDNVFGSQEEDALRRDFTINALFYDPSTQEILDYTTGVADLKKRVIRIIGDPEQRYREDPVRMLRAVRLAAKMDGEIEAKTRAPIKRLAALVQNVPTARLFDEMLKLLLSGHARDCVLRLRKEGLHHGLLPMLDVILEQPLGERFVMLALEKTDERVRADKPVSPGFLFAALLWHEVLAAWKGLEAEGLKAIPALHQAMDNVVALQVEKLAIPRRFTTDMKEIWSLQPRLLQRSGRRPYRLLEHPRFRAGFDFLQLRCESGEVDQDTWKWWDRFKDAGEDERARMLVPERDGAKRKRRRRKPRPAGNEALPAGS